MITSNNYEKAYISTNTTTQVYTGKCILHGIVVNTTAAGTIGIIDGTSGTSVNVGQLKASVAEGLYEYHCTMKNGIRIVTGASSDITVLYSTF
jgi:hypothetical protein